MPMTKIDKRADETNDQFCQRYADAIPAEELVRALVAYLDKRRTSNRRKPEAWSVIGKITMHGSGVSSAIARKYREKP